jgi:hypothetical protein
MRDHSFGKKWNMRTRHTLIAHSHEENTMFKKSLIVAASLALASSAFAQSGTKSPGASDSAPGQKMQNTTKSTAPGASEYAPGHKMQHAKKSTAPGASEYAPGHQTTGSSTATRKK